MTSTNSMPNPGSDMVNAVNEKVAIFRQLQEEINKGRSDLQTLLGQQTENEIVKQELDIMEKNNNSNAIVYKEMGPILMKQDLSEAQETVQKRLEFITGEMTRLQKSLKEKETKANETAKKVQEMQSAMQKAAVDAAMAVAAKEQQQA